MMKKISPIAIGTLTATFLYGSSCFAAAICQDFEPVKEELKNSAGEYRRTYKYPQFRFDDKTVEKQINDVLTKESKDIIKKDNSDKELVSAGLDYSVDTNMKQYLSLYMDSFTYHGGTHGISHREYFVFNLDNGERMKYTDFVPKITTQELWYGIRNGIIEAYSAESGLKTYAPDINDSVKVSGNFFLTDAGIEMVFDPYELDCYAMGRINVKLTTALIQQTKEAMQREESKVFNDPSEADAFLQKYAANDPDLSTHMNNGAKIVRTDFYGDVAIWSTYYDLIASSGKRIASITVTAAKEVFVDYND